MHGSERANYGASHKLENSAKRMTELKKKERGKKKTE